MQVLQEFQVMRVYARHHQLAQSSSRHLEHAALAARINAIPGSTATVWGPNEMPEAYKEATKAGREVAYPWAQMDKMDVTDAIAREGGEAFEGFVRHKGDARVNSRQAVSSSSRCRE